VAVELSENMLKYRFEVLVEDCGVWACGDQELRLQARGAVRIL
jgi:hypothetical protein